MPGVRPVSELLNDPVVPVAVIFVSAVVGFTLVLYTIPLSVMAAPPSDVTSPPLLADVEVMELAAVVVTVGAVTATGVVTPQLVVKPAIAASLLLI